jgi:hypothetical protein
LSQESSLKIGFLESSRFYEYKARLLRVDVTSFELQGNEKKEIGVKSFELDNQKNEFCVPRVSAGTGKLYDVFETQKPYKACRNCINQVNTHLDEIQSNYCLQDKTKLPGIIKEFGKWYEQLKVVTQVECNLLGLNKNNPETLCVK